MHTLQIHNTTTRVCTLHTRTLSYTVHTLRSHHHHHHHHTHTHTHTHIPCNMQSRLCACRDGVIQGRAVNNDELDALVNAPVIGGNLPSLPPPHSPLLFPISLPSVYIRLCSVYFIHSLFFFSLSAVLHPAMLSLLDPIPHFFFICSTTSGYAPLLPLILDIRLCFTPKVNYLLRTSFALSCLILDIRLCFTSRWPFASLVLSTGVPS